MVEMLRVWSCFAASGQLTFRIYCKFVIVPENLWEHETMKIETQPKVRMTKTVFKLWGVPPLGGAMYVQVKCEALFNYIVTINLYFPKFHCLVLMLCVYFGVWIFRGDVYIMLNRGMMAKNNSIKWQRFTIVKWHFF